MRAPTRISFPHRHVELCRAFLDRTRDVVVSAAGIGSCFQFFVAVRVDGEHLVLRDGCVAVVVRQLQQEVVYLA